MKIGSIDTGLNSLDKKDNGVMQISGNNNSSSFTLGDTKKAISSLLTNNTCFENGITYFSVGYLRKIEESLAKPTKGILEWFPLGSTNDINVNSRIDINKIELPTELFDAYKRYFKQILDEFTGYSQEKCDGYVVGLSGGIDSAVVLKLIQYSGYPVVPIIMGQGDHNADISEYGGTKAEWLDIQYAKNMCKDLGIDFKYIDLTFIINSFISSLNSESWVNSGISPRARSVILYTFADANNLISAGTTNGTEYILAAFSVGGPAGHISPIVDLYKSEVYAVAKRIGVPDYISDRKPLISELDIQDDSLYGVDCTIIDPVIRRLWFQKMSPEEVSKELGHSIEWIEKIKKLRIDGEKCRRNPTPFLVNRQLEIKHSPTVTIDRSHFNF